MTACPKAAMAAFAIALASACAETPGGSAADVANQPAASASETPAAANTAPGSGSAARFDAIGVDETIRLTGTEPFWGGTIAAGALTYTTPENQAGDTLAVRRFAGNNGLGFSGTLQGNALDLTITPGACSDGMSDRSYPFTATLRIGEEQRSGCAWTDRRPFTGPAAP